MSTRNIAVFGGGIVASILFCTGAMPLILALLYGALASFLSGTLLEPVDRNRRFQFKNESFYNNHQTIHYNKSPRFTPYQELKNNSFRPVTNYDSNNIPTNFKKYRQHQQYILKYA